MVASVGAERYDLPHTSCPLCIRKGSRGLTVGSPPRRPPRRRAGPAPGRPVLRPAPRRLRGRGHQGRGPGQRRPDAPVGPGEALRPVAVVAGGRPQQAVGHRRPAHRARPGPRPAHGRRGRRADRELPSRHAGALGPGPRDAVGDQPRSRGHPGHRVRADRTVRRPRGLRLDRRGDGRDPLRHRRPGPAAGPRRGLPRRLAGGDLRLPRHPRRAAPARAHRSRPGRRLRHLRGRPLPDGVARARVAGGRLPARADRYDAAQRLAEQRLPHRRRGDGPHRRQPGHRVPPAGRRHGPARARHRRAVRLARRPRQAHGGARRPDRRVEHDGARRRPARAPARRRRAGRAHLPRQGHAGRRALRGPRGDRPPGPPRPG